MKQIGAYNKEQSARTDRGETFKYTWLWKLGHWFEDVAGILFTSLIPRQVMTNRERWTRGRHRCLTLQSSAYVTVCFSAFNCSTAFQLKIRETNMSLQSSLFWQRVWNGSVSSQCCHAPVHVVPKKPIVLIKLDYLSLLSSKQPYFIMYFNVNLPGMGRVVDRTGDWRYSQVFMNGSVCIWLHFPFKAQYSMGWYICCEECTSPKQTRSHLVCRTNLLTTIIGISRGNIAL